MVEINVIEALEGKPRPHYLVGKAEYIHEKDRKLIAKVLFPTSRDSIYDRARQPIPHANIGDAYFAVWNAVHVICAQAGVVGTLTGNGCFEAKRPLPPNRMLDLEVILEETPANPKHIRDNYLGIFSLDGQELLRVSGNGIGKRQAQYKSEK